MRPLKAASSAISAASPMRSPQALASHLLVPHSQVIRQARTLIACDVRTRRLTHIQAPRRERSHLITDSSPSRSYPITFRRHESSLSGPGLPHENATPPTGGLARTSLYELHLSHGAKLVPFAGYEMPVQYSDLSVGDSHRFVRSKAGLFDVGHMVQHRLRGAGAGKFLERVTPSDTAALKAYTSTLSCLLHKSSGGIVDDTVIARLADGEGFYLVTNAACRKKDLAYLEKELQLWREEGGEEVVWDVRDGWGLVALQGPESANILKDLLEETKSAVAAKIDRLYFGQCAPATISLSGQEGPRFEVLISRAGYTGEDGFEISTPPEQTVAFTELLLKIGGKTRVRLTGLGARDSLRLEAGMCLYGHDLDDATTPVEAGLSWVIPKSRRATGGFHGSETILQQLKPAKEGGGVQRRRIGLTVEGAPAREGAEIVGPDDEVVGTVTSGCPSPTLGKNIAMGYVRNGLHKAGTELGVKVRGKKRPAVVTKMPFVASKYWKEQTPAGGTAPA